MLGLAVTNLNRPEVGRPRGAGTRAPPTTPYGTVEAHYAPVGAALLWTLEQGLGPDFTPEVREDWTETYGLVAGLMKGAAAEATA